jgi:hypothetical protein
MNFLSLISLWFDNVVLQQTCANNRLINLNKLVSWFINGIRNLFFITPYDTSRNIQRHATLVVA